MSPITCGMARKGVRHYMLYNLRSHGPDQTLLDLSTLPSTPRTPVRLYNAVGAHAAVPALHVQAVEGNPLANANEFIYPDIQKAIQDGEPLQAVGFGIKLRFVQDCFELVKAMDEEQKKMLRALEADEVVSQEKLDMFGQCELDYIEKCAEIAVEVIANDIQNMLQLANGTALASIFDLLIFTHIHLPVHVSYEDWVIRRQLLLTTGGPLWTTLYMAKKLYLCSCHVLKCGQQQTWSESVRSSLMMEVQYLLMEGLWSMTSANLPFPLNLMQDRFP
ncbi:hypothetical protein F5141DRAFT_1067757 [Pisolithus sp. B1]|nr:hypothetical protein F5141DRAFT_1067757 [Pisolithus sp. B1]